MLNEMKFVLGGIWDKVAASIPKPAEYSKAKLLKRVWGISEKQLTTDRNITRNQYAFSKTILGI